MTRRLTHPAPPYPERVTALPCRAHLVELRMWAGHPLDAAVAQAFAAEGSETGYLRLSDVTMSRLDFVRPAPAPGHGPVAWYSATTNLAPAHIDHAGLHLVRRNDAPFLHGHGIWRDETGHVHAGHLVGPDCRLARDVVVRG